LWSCRESLSNIAIIWLIVKYCKNRVNYVFLVINGKIVRVETILSVRMYTYLAVKKRSVTEFFLNFLILVCLIASFAGLMIWTPRDVILMYFSKLLGDQLDILHISPYVSFLTKQPIVLYCTVVLYCIWQADCWKTKLTCNRQSHVFPGMQIVFLVCKVYYITR